MRPAIEVRGRPASGGIFAGPLVHIAASTASRQPSGDAKAERTALEEAIAKAIADIAALMDAADDESAGILSFQAAMLEDDALRAPALAAIDAGEAADKAWVAALDGEIAGYAASGDDYFRARAADIKDLRDRVLRHLSGAAATVKKGGAVLAGEDVPPTLFLETDWSKGGAIALTGGSPSSHVAMLARARGVPMVVGLGEARLDIHTEAVVDGTAGLIVLSPDAETKSAFSRRATLEETERVRQAEFLHRPAALKDGTPVEVLVNIAGLDELAHIDPATCDGIGLMRSEFLFRDGAPLPDEEAQYAAYRRLLEWAGDKPVTIRTLDIGGDKPIRGLTPEGETNPFLGLRGVRLTLARPDIFKTQLRALARAAVHGKLKVMLPMVTMPAEIEASAALLDDCISELKGEGKACARPQLGIMVEVPAVAVVPELYANAAFFSIGSNDLTQYVTAASRDSPAVASLNDPAHPAIPKLIANVVRFTASANIPTSLCGDMASEPKHLGLLMDAGLRSISVAPAALARIKAALSEL